MFNTDEYKIMLRALTVMEIIFTLMLNVVDKNVHKSLHSAIVKINDELGKGKEVETP